MNLNENYKNRLQDLAGIKKENQEWYDFANQVNKTWIDKIKTDKTAKPEDSILFGALCDTYELSDNLANKILIILNQYIGKQISDNDEAINKIHTVISKTTGEHPGPLNQPSSTSKEDLKNFIKTNETATKKEYLNEGTVFALKDDVGIYLEDKFKFIKKDYNKLPEEVKKVVEPDKEYTLQGYGGRIWNKGGKINSQSRPYYVIQKSGEVIPIIIQDSDKISKLMTAITIGGY